MKVKLRITHRDLEGTVGDVLPSETDTDDILARLRRCVEDVKCAVLVFNNVHVELCPLGCDHTACHLAFPRRLGIDCDDCLLTNLDRWANTSALRIKNSSDFFFYLVETQTGTHSLSHTHITFSMHIPQP